MVRGRDSLARLVGKRRRISSPDRLLSDLLSRFSSANKSRSESCVLSSPSMETSAKTNQTSAETDSVICPVCGKTAPGARINEHLDTCLTRGSKRKLTQCTLLQFSIGSGIHQKKDDESQTQKFLLRCQQHTTAPIMENGTNSVVIESKSSDSRKTFLGSSAGTHAVCTVLENANYSVTNGRFETNMDCCSKERSTEYEKPRIDDVAIYSNTRLTSSTGVGALQNCSLLSNEQVPSSIGFQGNVSDNGNFDDSMDNNLVGVLDTCIVGRRFNLQTTVEQGASISLIRDINNSKDKNAIKVTYSDSGNGVALGYLPRELALHLSPLLDSNELQIKGIITAVPAINSAPVPKKLFCKKGLNCAKEHFSDRASLLECYWPKAVIMAKLMSSGSSESKYQRNFKYVIQTILDLHKHLLTDEENKLLESFESLSGDSQRLFVRLYQRKGPWFRMSQLSYVDVTDMDLAYNELLESGFITSLEYEIKSVDMVTKDMLGVLTVPELKQLANLVAIERRDVVVAKREELLVLLTSGAQDKESTLLDSSNEYCIQDLCCHFQNIAGRCLQISQLARTVLWRAQRLFFLNGEQDLSTFLLVDMGLIKYPEYSCKRSQCIFANVHDFRNYEQALLVAQIMDTAIEKNDMPKVEKCIEISSAFLDDPKENNSLLSYDLKSHSLYRLQFTAAWVYTKVLTLGVSVLERERRYEEAIQLLKDLLGRDYCPGQRGLWTMRLSIDLEHIGHIEESLQIAEKGIEDAWVRSGARMALQRRILRLGKPPRRWKRPLFSNNVLRKIKEVYITGRPLNAITGIKSIFYGYDDERCTVEQLALQYYAGNEGGDWQGIHSEGGIWLTYFALLMWDAIFAEVPDVFLTPFQNAPLDLGTDSFYASRQDLIDAQLRRIRTDVEAVLANSWEAHYGTSCQGLRWDRYSLEELKVIASSIGGSCLAALCKLLSEDYRSWSSGMPDLLLWRRTSPTEESQCSGTSSDVCYYGTSIANSQGEGEAKLVEVKGPRDRLSEQQRAWILVLIDAGFNVELCRITDLPKHEK